MNKGKTACGKVEPVTSTKRIGKRSKSKKVSPHTLQPCPHQANGAEWLGGLEG
jgi:hypothetical protein